MCDGMKGAAEKRKAVDRAPLSYYVLLYVWNGLRVCGHIIKLKMRSEMYVA